MKQFDLSKMNHPGKAITRRELISQGLLSASGFLFMPSVLEIILGSRNASAAHAVCGGGGSAGAVPFFVVDCYGGLSIGGNFLPMGANGQPLSSYNTLAVPDSIGLGSTGGSLNYEFGAPYYNNNSTRQSGIAQGMKDVINVYNPSLAPAIIARTGVASLCTFSRDDSEVNEFNAAALVNKMGAVGSLVSTPLGSFDGGLSGSGGRQRGPALVPGKALRINQPSDIAQALQMSGAVQLTPKQKELVAKAAANLTASQSANLAGMTFADQYNTLVECGYLKASQLANGNPASLVGAPASFSGFFANQAQENIFGPMENEKSMIYNTLVGNAGPSVLGINGCDYHGKDRVGYTDKYDYRTGALIARIICAAAALGKKAMIQVVTDGANSTGPNQIAWNSDSGERGMTLLIYYDPAQPRAMRRTQLGNFTSGQIVDTTQYIGNDPTRVAFVALLNWLNVQGRLSEFPSLVPASLFDPSQYDKHLIFG